MAAAKVAYGIFSGSASIMADGIHSTADAASNVVALIAIWVAGMPPDEGHPYGHRKFEVLGSLFIGIMILVGMMGVGYRTFAVESPPLHVGPGGFSVVILTLVINIVVATWEAREGQRLGSALLQADSRHTASDVMSTIAVLIAFITESLGWRGMDKAAALFIMVMIGLASWEIFRGAIDVLADAAPLVRLDLKAHVLEVDGVVDCHKIRSRGIPREVHVDLHIQVIPSLTVEEGHTIAHRVQSALRSEYPQIVEVVVHTEPANEEQLAAFAARQG